MVVDWRHLEEIAKAGVRTGLLSVGCHKDALPVESDTLTHPHMCTEKLMSASQKALGLIKSFELRVVSGNTFLDVEGTIRTHYTDLDQYRNILLLNCGGTKRIGLISHTHTKKNVNTLDTSQRLLNHIVFHFT